MIDDVGDLVGEAIGGLFGSTGPGCGPRRSERERRAREQGKGHASVWVIRGTVPGLGGRWCTRTWSVRSGALTCRAVVLVIDAIDYGHRRPTLREHWGPARRTHILVAPSGAARVEIAVTASQVDRVLDALDPGPRTA